MLKIATPAIDVNQSWAEVGLVMVGWGGGRGWVCGGGGNRVGGMEMGMGWLGIGEELGMLSGEKGERANIYIYIYIYSSDTSLRTNIQNSRKIKLSMRGALFLFGTFDSVLLLVSEIAAELRQLC